MQAPPEEKLFVAYDRRSLLKILPILAVLLVVSLAILYFAFTSQWLVNTGRRQMMKILLVVACALMAAIATAMIVWMTATLGGRKAALEGDSEGLTIGLGAGKPIRYTWNEIEAIYLHSGPQSSLSLCIKPTEASYHAKTSWLQRVVEGLSVMGTGAPYALSPSIMDRPYEEVKSFIERHKPIRTEAQ